MKQLVAIYRSNKKADTYLYLPKKDDFNDVPEQLMSLFGKPQLLMLLPLPSQKTLKGVSQDKLLDELQSKGYYLQLPPQTENLLEQHRVQQGLSKHIPSNN